MSSLVWFRRDLRLDDNPAWSAATADDDAVEALFVLDQRLLTAAGSLRRNLLFTHLQALDARLQHLGGGLTVETGNPKTIVPGIAAEHDAAYWNRSYTPFSRRRDDAIERAIGLPVETFDGDVVHPPEGVMTGGGTPYRVFTPYHRTWSQMPIPGPSQAGHATVLGRRNREIPNAEAPPMVGGDVAAHERLEQFLEIVDRYEDDRNRPDLDRTSHLSADLKFGTISARAVAERVGRSTPARSAFVRQLAWRDFYAQLLFHAPQTVTHAFREDLESIKWAEDDAGVLAWQEGRTGYPIVDAGMRQLNQEGWMHGRVRMIAASFLVKDLGVDWRIGERHFRRLLIDADPSQNVGNWQWVAGTGADAAPYFRIMNPVAQSRQFDPDGAYIRRHVLELAALQGAEIHAPWERPLETAAAGVTLGRDYPYPLADHAEAREITLRRFGAAKA